MTPSTSRLPIRFDVCVGDQPLLTRLDPRPRAALKLYCFPYAGASSNVFRGWRHAVPAEVELCGIQLPGRAQLLERPPLRRLHDLVRELGPALARTLDRPFALVGHSLGAIVAFEVARWLRSRREKMPECLFVSGHRAPQCPDVAPQLHRLSDRGFLARLVELNGMPQEIVQNTELLTCILPVLRADFEMAETYVYADGAPLPCPIVAFGGSDDPETADGKLEAWREQTTGECSVHVLDGDHFFIRSSERVFFSLLCKYLCATTHTMP